MTSTSTIYTAFSEAVIDTFEALYKSPRLDDPATVKSLEASYLFLQEEARVEAQVLFDNISRGVYDLTQASDHHMLVSGDNPRELACDTCGRLISYHSQPDAYASLLTAVQDIEAIALLHDTVAAREV